MLRATCSDEVSYLCMYLEEQTLFVKCTINILKAKESKGDPMTMLDADSKVRRMYTVTSIGSLQQRPM